VVINDLGGNTARKGADQNRADEVVEVNARSRRSCHPGPKIGG
jgi:hypothetical protein